MYFNLQFIIAQYYMFVCHSIRQPFVLQSGLIPAFFFDLIVVFLAKMTVVSVIG